MLLSASYAVHVFLFFYFKSGTLLVHCSSLLVTRLHGNRFPPFIAQLGMYADLKALMMARSFFRAEAIFDCMNPQSTNDGPTDVFGAEALFNPLLTEYEFVFPSHHVQAD